jgi:hypothetical protein
MDEGFLLLREVVWGGGEPDSLNASASKDSRGEDAISGVQAGRTGSFGLVIGVARSDDPEVLRQNGADIVVRDLAELRLV